MKILLLAMFLVVISCGGDSSTGLNGGGSIAIVVKNAQSTSQRSIHGKVEQYRIEVTGEGIDEPIIAIFDGNAESGFISGVPIGEKRHLSVKAINPTQRTIKAGEVEGISIESGRTAQEEVELESVPIFTNLVDGSSIDNTRLTLRFFSAPGDLVEVEDRYEGSDQTLVNPSTARPEIDLDLVTGLGALSPPIAPTGEHIFLVRSLRNNRSTKVMVRLLDGTRRRAAPLVVTGSVQQGGGIGVQIAGRLALVE